MAQHNHNSVSISVSRKKKRLSKSIPHSGSIKSKTIAKLCGRFEEMDEALIQGTLSTILVDMDQG